MVKTYEKEARKYYKRWMKETTYCPALQSRVRVTRKGWDHIVSGSKSKKRREQDKRMRLNLLKVAKHIIKNATSVVVTVKNNTTYYELKDYAWKTNKNSEVKYFKAKVILKKDKQGNYFFYSVMKA